MPGDSPPVPGDPLGVLPELPGPALDVPPEVVGPEPDGLPESVGPVAGEEPVGEELAVGAGEVTGPVTGVEGLPPEGGTVGRADGDVDAPPGEWVTDSPGRSPRGVSVTALGFSEGSPGTGSTVRGANGVAPMKLSASTPVYAAHSAPAA